ncbi:MAG: glucosamine-6-phosphate deaminase [Planctomycetota bacterium]
MRVIIEQDSGAVARRAAGVIAALLRRQPSCVLGLATGSSPIGTYQELIRMHREEGLDFSRATTFNLDEYAGLGPEHPQSYRFFMQRQLFDHVNVAPGRTHVPDGLAADFDVSCAEYESRILAAGGIDLQLLGIGADGHIAFNEPGSSLASRTRLKSLVRETIRDNARFFGSEDLVPRLAVTMGVGTILDARQCLLVATGRGKAEAIRGMVEGPLTASNTASALQWHPLVCVVLDEDAASLLERREYYRDSERCQQLLEAGERQALGLPAVLAPAITKRTTKKPAESGKSSHGNSAKRKFTHEKSVGGKRGGDKSPSGRAKRAK